MRVLIIDDDAVMRGRLASLLEDELDGVVLGHAGDAASGLAAVRAAPWDLVLLDVHLPDRTGLEVLPELVALRPGLPVVVVTALGSAGYEAAALARGASAFVEKSHAADRLVPLARALTGHGAPRA